MESNYLYTTIKTVDDRFVDIDVHYTVWDDGEGDVGIYVESLHTKSTILSSNLLNIKEEIEKELYHYHAITGD